MSLLRLKHTTECVPDQFRFTHETGHTTRGMEPHGWWTDVLNYRRINGLPIPDDLRAQAEDQLCKTLPPGWCEYADTGQPAQEFINIRVEPQDVMNATKVFGSFVLSGMQLVPMEEADRRAAICAACPANVGLQGCGACVGFAEIVAGVVGAAKTKSDEKLVNRSCAWCKCSSKAQAHVPIEVLAKGVTDEMLARNPFSWCWKANQIKELRASSALPPP